MQHKVSFTIPIIGLALTGCQDPVISDWDLQSIGDLSLPHTETYSGTYYGYQYSCSLTLSATDLTIDEDFKADMDLQLDLNCTIDGESYSDSANFGYNGFVTVGKKEVSYGIQLNGSEDLNLDCSMSGKSVLTCDDDNGTTWKFNKIDD